MRLILVFISILLSASMAHTSSWEECYFLVRVSKVTATEVVVSAANYTGGNGMAGSPGKGNCMAHIKENKIPKEQVVSGLKLARKNRWLVAHRRTYSAMGPAGEVGGVSWKLSIKKRNSKKKAQ